MVQESGLAQLLRRRLQAQADLFASLTKHPTIIGTGREEALAELLRQFMPRRFEVLEGTVALLDADRRPARSTQQLDIIVADTTDFPTLLRSGHLAVVLAQSVRAVMEVKSDLKRGISFLSALIQICRARQVLGPTDPVFSGLFSFGAPTKPETLRDWLEDVLALRRLLETGQGDDSTRKTRDALLGAGDDDVAIADEAELLAILANENLPNIIAADEGAVARKVAADSYTFLRGGDDVPSVMVVVDQLVEQLAAASSTRVNDAFGVVRAHLLVEVIAEQDLEDLLLPVVTPSAPVAS